jgi:hypothetical protein
MVNNMLDPKNPPQTPEEIAQAKILLREAFAHAVENEKAWEKTPEGIEALRENASLMREYGVTDSEIEASNRKIDANLAAAQREVTAGTPAGEDILDLMIANWQFLSELPPFLLPQPPLSQPAGQESIGQGLKELGDGKGVSSSEMKDILHPKKKNPGPPGH